MGRRRALGLVGERQGPRAGGQQVRQPLLHEPRSHAAVRLAQLRGDGRFRCGRSGEIRRRGASRKSRTRFAGRSTPSDVRLILTTGDNIYAGTRLHGHSDWRHRRRRRRLVLHLLSAVPLRDQSRAGVSVDRKPRRGRNRRARRSRAGRRQLLSSRAPHRRRRGGRSRVVLLRVSSIVFATDRTSSSCASTRRRKASFEGIGCSSIQSTGNSSKRRFRRTREQTLWRIPFCHHPPYCAGPQHGNTKGMARLIPAVRSDRA